MTWTFNAKPPYSDRKWQGMCQPCGVEESGEVMCSTSETFIQCEQLPLTIAGLHWEMQARDEPRAAANSQY